ncbi:acyl-CoA synthetase [Halovulum sp. GXIMD14793]
MAEAKPGAIANVADKLAIENEMPFEKRWPVQTLYEQLSKTEAEFGSRPAVSFQIKSGPNDKKETLSWTELKRQVTQAANLFRKLGVSETDAVSYVLPNCNEAPITLLAGATAGIVNPINPLLDPEHIGAILHETGAKVVVTLAPFPKTDVNGKVMEALKHAPNITHVLQVDLKRYLTPPTSWLVPLLRPKPVEGVKAKVLDFNTAIAAENGDKLAFDGWDQDRIGAYFHTGGTTGMPKVAQHMHRGMIYNGWCGHSYMFTEKDVLICPLPMFHVFAAYPVFMSCLNAGAHMVLPTPAGYRGDGVFDNFWKLIERYKGTFMITVPTAAAALMQRPVDADISSLVQGVSGSAPMPVELFRKFEDATGIQVLEGYGMTEATCLVSINPPGGERKVGSVGIPFPYCDVRILHMDAEGNVTKDCDTDEIGEICVSNPGVLAGRTYIEANRNKDLFADEKYLRTGDLGRIDSDGYLWITGRAKDLIIRGGHNIDPAEIEEALMGHEAVAFVGAIGQPDAHSGELPCAYVELRDGAEVEVEALLDYAKEHIGERAAQPKYLEVLDELPKTAVGKIFKPDLRKMAIKRVFDAALKEADLDVSVAEVVEDKRRGLTAQLVKGNASVSDEAVTDVLGSFYRPWQWQE